MTNPHDPDRLLEDDHDLLTFGESGARLKQEIAAAEAALAHGGDPGSDVDVTAVTARLSALRAAAERNAVTARDDVHGSGFLNYRPPPA